MTRDTESSKHGVSPSIGLSLLTPAQLDNGASKCLALQEFAHALHQKTSRDHSWQSTSFLSLSHVRHAECDNDSWDYLGDAL